MSNLDDLKRAMSALPAKESAADVSLKKKVAALRSQIHELHFDKKWTWSEIAAWLTEQGERITESTLKLYYYKSAPRASKPRKADKPAPTAAAPAADAAGAAAVGSTSRVNPVLE